MSTRSRIAVADLENEGLYFQIYCHNDGYLSGVGKTLLNDYSSREKALSLVMNGDISTLGSDLDKTTFYEKGIQNPQYKKSELTDFDYTYCLESDGKWYSKKFNETNFKLLSI
jgi:hypothetical protein